MTLQIVFVLWEGKAFRVCTQQKPWIICYWGDAGESSSTFCPAAEALATGPTSDSGWSPHTDYLEWLRCSWLQHWEGGGSTTWYWTSSSATSCPSPSTRWTQSHQTSSSHASHQQSLDCAVSHPGSTPLAYIMRFPCFRHHILYIDLGTGTICEWCASCHLICLHLYSLRNN